ncbi:MAG: TIGR03790 family protein [Candidatus Eisenbacteria bacterium]|nr:TIGR03790 family protein [Candidatus Eisenbacteria bacterium]
MTPRPGSGRSVCPGPRCGAGKEVCRRIALIGLISLTTGGCAEELPRPTGGTDARVLVVANHRSEESRRLARLYLRSRDLRASHLLELSLPKVEEIDRPIFERMLVAPLVDWWQATPDSLLPQYVVLMRGVPLKIRGGGGRDADQSAVDSELTLLPRLAQGESIAPRGKLPNPYYEPSLSGPFPAFDRQERNLVLVTRLDAFSAAEVESLIARAASASARLDHPTGSEPRARSVLLDQKDASRLDLGNSWLRAAARAVASAGAEAVLDTTGVYRTDLPGDRSLVGYASWGSNDPSYRRESRLRWEDGGIATAFVSTSARTLREPPPRWFPGPADDRARHFGGSAQSLIGDLIRDGATGAAGSVYEPYLDGCVRPEFLFAAYLSGRTLGESFYLATPFVSWMGIVLGDPLARIASPGGPEPPAELGISDAPGR